jgi:hypothetical protein
MVTCGKVMQPNTLKTGVGSWRKNGRVLAKRLSLRTPIATEGFYSEAFGTKGITNAIMLVPNIATASE